MSKRQEHLEEAARLLGRADTAHRAMEEQERRGNAASARELRHKMNDLHAKLVQELRKANEA